MLAIAGVAPVWAQEVDADAEETAPPVIAASKSRGEAPVQPQAFVSPILTLDQDSLFSNSALGRRIISGLERDRDALASENRRIEAELFAEEQSLTDRRAALSPENFARLAAEFDEKVQQMRQTQDRKSRILQQRLEAERQTFASLVGPVLIDLARERGAVAILDNTVVLISFDVIDITDVAIARLNDTIGDGGSSLGTSLPDQGNVRTNPNLRPTPRVMPDLGLSPSSAEE